MKNSWYGVVSASAPGVASQDAADSKVESFEGAVFAEGFEGVLGACRGEAAAWLLERRETYLIESYQEDEGGDCRLLDDVFISH